MADKVPELGEEDVPLRVDSSENDSAYGDDEISSYATTLSSSAEQYKWQHNRRYHSYREGVYKFPNDEAEQDRFDLLHHVCLLVMGGVLHLTSLSDEAPLRILDIATGTGIWALDMGDKYPNAQVIGNDLSPIQPKWVPPNVSFEVDDCESPWPPREAFDFIHTRYLVGAIKDWHKLLRRAYDQLVPGGWIELHDFNTIPYSGDGSASPDNMFVQFCEVFNRACNKMGRHGSPGQHLKSWVEEAGFTNIQHKVYQIPIGPWAKDQNMKQIGALFLIIMNESLEAALVGLLTEVEGWDIEEVQVFIAKTKEALKRRSLHTIYDFHVVWAQKPEK